MPDVGPIYEYIEPIGAYRKISYQIINAVLYGLKDGMVCEDEIPGCEIAIAVAILNRTSWASEPKVLKFLMLSDRYIIIDECYCGTAVKPIRDDNMLRLTSAVRDAVWRAVAGYYTDGVASDTIVVVGSKVSVM